MIAIGFGGGHGGERTREDPKSGGKPRAHTRRLGVEHGGFVYGSDTYNDDLPCCVQFPKTGALADAAAASVDSFVWHLVVSYTLCINDSKFTPGLASFTPGSFSNFMRDALDVLLEEAEATKRPRMTSVGLYLACFRGLQKVLHYVRGLKRRVWVCSRIDIAQHWSAMHPPPSIAIGVPAHVRQSRHHGRRLLVAKEASFVLSNLVHHWLHGDASATVVVPDPQRAWDSQVQALLAPLLRIGRLAFCDGDVISAATLTKLGEVHGVAFHHMVSAAAVTPTVQEEQSKPYTVLAVNFDGSVRCLEKAGMHCASTLSIFVRISNDAFLGVPGLVVPSSYERRSAILGELPDMSLYALSKVVFEFAVRRRRVLHNLETVSMSFSDVYGRLDRDTGDRNRHKAPYWVCRKDLIRDREGENHRTWVVAESLDWVGWDLIGSESVLLIGSQWKAQPEWTPSCVFNLYNRQPRQAVVSTMRQYVVTSMSQFSLAIIGCFPIPWTCTRCRRSSVGREHRRKRSLNGERQDGKTCNMLLGKIDAKTQIGDMWILGMPFFRAYYVNFKLGENLRDMSARRMTIAAASRGCSPVAGAELDALAPRMTPTYVNWKKLQIPRWAKKAHKRGVMVI